MRNAALLVALVVVLLAAFTGVLATPFLAAAAVLLTFVLGRASTRANAKAAELPQPVLEFDVTQVSQRDDLGELQSSLALLARGTAADNAVLWRIDGDIARPVAAANSVLPPALPLRGNPLAWVAREGTPIRFDLTPHWAADGSRVIALRLFARENRGWILTLELKPATDFIDYATYDTAAAPLRLLVELKDRRSDTDADRRRLEQLLDVLRRIPVAIDLETFGEELITAALRLTGGTGGVVGVWDGARGRVVGVVGVDGGPQIGAEFEPPASELALAIRAGVPLVRSTGAWKPGPTQIANAADRWAARPREFVALPLVTHNGTPGVLGLWTTDGELDDAGIQLISAIAPYAAMHLEHATAYGRLQKTADTDGLTSLHNRRAFDAALAAEASRFERYGRPLSLLLVDLDHFKNVNDTFGHEAGDEVLRRVAEIIRACVRDVDTPARYGGEEFAVLLPETPVASARDVAERIRVSVEAAAINFEGRSIPVTVSIGIASAPEHTAAADALVGDADEALYAAKEAGRNRVVG